MGVRQRLDVVGDGVAQDFFHLAQLTQRLCDALAWAKLLHQVAAYLRAEERVSLHAVWVLSAQHVVDVRARPPQAVAIQPALGIAVRLHVQPRALAQRVEREPIQRRGHPAQEIGRAPALVVRLQNEQIFKDALLPAASPDEAQRVLHGVGEPRPFVPAAADCSVHQGARLVAEQGAHLRGDRLCGFIVEVAQMRLDRLAQELFAQVFVHGRGAAAFARPAILVELPVGVEVVFHDLPARLVAALVGRGDLYARDRHGGEMREHDERALHRGRAGGEVDQQLVMGIALVQRLQAPLEIGVEDVEQVRVAQLRPLFAEDIHGKAVLLHQPLERAAVAVVLAVVFEHLRGEVEHDAIRAMVAADVQQRAVVHLGDRVRAADGRKEHAGFMGHELPS